MIYEVSLGVLSGFPYFGITWVKYLMSNTFLHSGHTASVVFTFDIRDSVSMRLGDYINP